MRNFKGSRYDSSLSVSDIIKKTREFIKNDPQLSQCKWSITKDRSTWTSSINVCLMEAPFNPFTECYGIEGNGKYYIQNAEHSSSDWITDKAKDCINKVYDYIHSFNYDNSDPYTDYFDTFFYERYCIGKWDKPFKICDKKSHRNYNKRGSEKATGLEIINYSEKSFAVIGSETKEYKDVLSILGGRFNSHLSIGCGWIFPNDKEELVRNFLNI